MKQLILLALLACVLPAHAQQVLCPAVPSEKPKEYQLCWENAAKDVNGNNLPASGPYSLVSTRIQRAKVGASASCNFDTVAQTVSVPPTTLAKLFKDLPNGKHCFRIRHVSHDKKGAELYGQWSKTASRVVK